MLLGAFCALLLQGEPVWEDWKVVGPWPVESADVGMATELPPEDLLARIQRGGDPDPRGSYSRDDGERVRWQDEVRGYPVDLSRQTGATTTSVVFLYRAVEIKQPGNLPVELSADGRYRVWLNGKVVAETPTEIAEAGSTLELELPVQVGLNHLLVKVAGPPNRLSFGMRTSFRWQSELGRCRDRSTLRSTVASSSCWIVR